MESKELDSELESFRLQWLSDLRSRTDASGSSQHAFSSRDAARQPGSPPISPIGRRHVPAADHPATVGDDEHDSADLHGRAFDDAPSTFHTGHTLESHSLTAGLTTPKPKELVSALDHFEEAMIKEAQGNMGDSLKLYRRAYKLDNGVDRRYREKHFPIGSKPPAPAQAPKPGDAAPQLQVQKAGDQQQQQPQSMADLIASFSSLAIEPIPAEAEGMPQPPCPVSDLPDELLVHILLDVAIHDVADFTRLSLVCKRFAYLVSTEQRVWREVCLTDKFGFPGMLHHWGLAVEWDPLDDDDEEKEDGSFSPVVSLRELNARRHAEKLLVTRSLTPSVYATWKAMFRHRPRIRFNGVYISTVNYVRSGQASTNQATWGGSPIHIVTYYRYLRFFRDGAVISLLSTSEPGDVVHHLTKDLLRLHRERDRSHASALPSAIMHLGLKGRWRLSSALEDLEASPSQQEGDLFIETEGVHPKYMYRMDLSLRSAGKGARNTKLNWRGFYSYNKLTDDWAEFGLKNDKPFFFSRVKSYGLA